MDAQPKPVKTFGVRLDRDLLERFEIASAANGSEKTEEIRRLVRERVEEFEAEVKDAA